MARSFFWFDLETFGLNPRYDRIVQFAGLRTDENFEPVGDRIILYCRPTPDYLPSPGACLVHGITPQAASASGLSEYEFAKRIRAELCEPGTVSLGYNTIQFDDEFIRNLFYRNFFDPYEREYKNGSSRWDIINLVRAAHDLRPEGLVWPRAEDGRPIFTLEALSKANGVDQGAAHDAMHDVLATIGMAKLIRTKQPRLFDWYYEHRTKDSLYPLINLPDRTPLVHTAPGYTSPEGCTTLIAPISIDPEIRSQMIAVDLRADPQGLVDLPVDELRRRVFTKAAELEVERLPLARIRLNKSPFLAPANTLSDEAAARLGIDREACAAHLDFIRHQPELIQKFSAVFSGPIDAPVESDPELRLYSGFFGDEDNALFAKLHETLAAAGPEEAKSRFYRFHFQDDRPPQMLRRFFARNYPETMNESEATRWRSFCASRLQMPPVADAADLGSFGKTVEQKLANPSTPARDKSILLSLLAYKSELESDVLQYSEKH